MSKKRREIPVFDHPIIETHCHLDYLKDRPLSDTLEQSQRVNIEKVITIAVSPDNLAAVRELAGSADWVFGTQGIHPPHEAETYTDEVEAEIRQHATDDKIVAVGEIGLDYFYDNADRSVQREVFRRQLQIACDSDCPVVIHSRDADDDTIAILKEFEHSLERRGGLFTASPPGPGWHDTPSTRLVPGLQRHHHFQQGRERARYRTHDAHRADPAGNRCPPVPDTRALSRP